MTSTCEVRAVVPAAEPNYATRARAAAATMSGWRVGPSMAWQRAVECYRLAVEIAATEHAELGRVVEEFRRATATSSREASRGATLVSRVVDLGLCEAPTWTGVSFAAVEHVVASGLDGDEKAVVLRHLARMARGGTFVTRDQARALLTSNYGPWPHAADFTCSPGCWLWEERFPDSATARTHILGEKGWRLLLDEAAPRTRMVVMAYCADRAMFDVVASRLPDARVLALTPTPVSDVRPLHAGSIRHLDPAAAEWPSDASSAGMVLVELPTLAAGPSAGAGQMGRLGDARSSGVYLESADGCFRSAWRSLASAGVLAVLAANRPRTAGDMDRVDVPFQIQALLTALPGARLETSAMVVRACRTADASGLVQTLQARRLLVYRKT